MTTKTITISGMHCTSCALNIDFDLEDLPGVKSARTNYPKSQTVITFDETQIKLPQILAQIRSTGYTAAI